MSLYPLQEGGSPALTAALAAAGLPVADLDQPDRRFFRWGVTGAFGGIEGSGADVLLRSVVVPPEKRGDGIGHRLVDALAKEAGRNGAQRLWLLTTGAAPFFAQCGFRTVERGAAPTAIAASEEFRCLCPDSAVLMVRPLPGGR